MPTVDEVRRDLDKDELDYFSLAAELGEGALDQLEALVMEDEPRIASKAAYLAAMISGSTSARVVDRAAGSRHDVVRVSAAASLGLLPVDEAAGVAARLLGDTDSGVRAKAARFAVQSKGPDLVERVRRMAAEDNEPAVRQLARTLLVDQF
jgi:HEAT repeat protein